MEETENIPVKTEEEAGEPTEASPVATSVAKDSGEISDTETQPVFPQATVAMLQSVPNQTENFLILDQNGQALQCERMVIVTGHTENGQVYVIPSNHQGAAQVLLPHGQLLDIPHMTDACVDKSSHNALQTVTLATLSNDANSLALATPQNVTPTKTVPKSPSDDFVSPLKPASSKTPDWALRLRCYEKIGDSYRGYCNTEAELEAVLLLHKQQTHSIFGTRQSPSPAKPATRLMWKSQYVPYDGIPFVNAGSRAIVMECQFGPRRKGQQPKKGAEQETNQNADYKATCPARIYIKKVRKFPEYRVPTDPKVDKKVVRQEQEKAFFNLKKGLWDAGGVIRYYVQLPTRKAHLYHDMDKLLLLPYPEQPLPEEREMTEEEPEEGGSEGEGAEEDESCVPSRLHPHVAEKIRELVAQGHKQVYSVRKQLRKFVEREMFKSVMVPEKHNLCYFPTFNDIKNHIHEAQKALQLAAPGPDATHTQWEAETGDSLTESVKAAVLEASDSLSPEAVQLFSSLTPLQPKTSQLQTVEVQLTPSPTEGDPPQQPVPAELFPVPVAPQPLLLSPTRFLQPSGSLGFTVTLAEPPLTGLSPTAEAEHGATVTQIILQDGRALPVQIVDPASIALPAPVDEAPLDEESLTSPAHSPAD